MERAKTATGQMIASTGGRGRLLLRADTHKRSDSPFAKIERRAMEIRYSKRKEKLDRIRSGSRQRPAIEEEDGYHTGKEDIEDINNNQ